MKILNSKYDAQLKEIVLLHNITKHYILLGEETDLKFNSYLQPIKEFRDAYDHLLRVFRSILFNDETNYDSEYIEKQLSKALGHHYRAFFDVADWFSIICRNAAQEAMDKNKSNIDDIIANYPKYKECAEFLNDCGKEVAHIRERKDVGTHIADLVNEYQELMMKIYEAMLYVRNVAVA